MRGLTLWPLARRLRAYGYAPEPFDYASLWRSPAEAADRLAHRLLAMSPGPVHLVGHSLGGLVALETVAGWAGLPHGRIVCLGSPLAGSGAARGMARWRLDGWLGRSRTLLKAGLHALPPGREVGVIAGIRPLGLGKLFAGFDGPHDGTVALWETRLPGLADHVAVHSSHTGLLLDARVAALTAGFLATGRFPDLGQGASPARSGQELPTRTFPPGRSG
ncbi:alpha/beta hydrolase [Arenimonas fontis]|uniref:Alpha/beta hydrolase n=2 Tax=Arenimonas fontis TaxID=2608255 RepID=A0A5B2ZAY3_9GAMM|nr:alpha/beta hydrolase [Arenimonas fontis]